MTTADKVVSSANKFYPIGKCEILLSMGNEVEIPAVWSIWYVLYKCDNIFVQNKKKRSQTKLGFSLKVYRVRFTQREIC